MVMKTVVLLDSNLLFLPHRQKIDVFSEIQDIVPETHEIVTLSTVVSELERLKEMKSEDGVAARIGLELLRRNNVRVIEAEGQADESIIKFALENKRDVIVCTNDVRLKNQLNKKGIQLILMRSKNHLVRF